ncbi:TetR/AcrR family transcriptional regulator [Glaciihabitans arcticus]|uniref:TetR/AcrR family transcriptional regulator n=1 Tax=Glaciihabitans arcticus TaxID=2668039 RepID=A0A4V2JER0_9MICO|nr:TetR/AcrR family transcriptional regulator [Glaciihabitans arcticus]TBN56499.1 TetR/AcrR family transcriptional regulator [Glaciihabitans arcticus]
MDARQLRTRARLATAVLQLGAQKPITQVSVSELAAAAEINRSTFYEHSDSPAALLRATLRAELDQIRDRNLAAIENVPKALQNTTSEVLEHVASHDEIYQRGLGLDDDSGELHSMLSAHFQGSVHQLLDSGHLKLPASTYPDLLSDTVARFVADGTVGAIEAWLRTPSPRDNAAFIETYYLVMPAWWPKPKK